MASFGALPQRLSLQQALRGQAYRKTQTAIDTRSPATPSGVIARVYDRANAPDSILEMPLLVASSRAFSTSGPGNRNAI